jgi:hypothetical protein
MCHQWKHGSGMETYAGVKEGTCVPHVSEVKDMLNTGDPCEKCSAQTQV